MSARRNGNRARCQHEGCEKFAQTRGLCKAHGGGSRCRDPSCNKLAQSRGLCIAHGGGRRCQHEGCSKLAQSKGFCISHGGGRRCTVPNCEKFSQVKGRCKSHSKLADNSDNDGDDGDETESDRTTASPQHPRGQYTQRQHHARTSSSSPHRSSRADAAPAQPVDFLANTLPPLQHHHSQDTLSLPPPHSFGLMATHEPLLPSRSLIQSAARHETVQPHHQAAFNRPSQEEPTRPSQIHHWEESHKYATSGTTRSHSDEELPPLPYTYSLPPARPLFGNVEEKREQDEQHHGYTLLPSRFLQSRPPSSMASTGTLPTVSSIIAASASTVTSHVASSHDHFIGHRHAEPVTAVEPTSIPLLSFLDRSKETTSSPPMHAHTSWTTTSSSSTVPTSSTTTSIGTTATREGGSPPLPSIVLPPLKHSHQNPR